MSIIGSKQFFFIVAHMNTPVTPQKVGFKNQDQVYIDELISLLRFISAR